jgi:membrane associated rhomboid family serine protease
MSIANGAHVTGLAVGLAMALPTRSMRENEHNSQG